MWFSSRARLVPRVLAARQFFAKTFRATPRASAATRVRASSGRIAAVDATADAIAVADALIGTAVVVDGPIAADAPEAGLVSNAGGPAAQDTIVATREAVPAPRAARSLFRKC